jgi:hypothetical protein
VLAADGSLEVKVEGLVLATTGANPVPSFPAIESCQTILDGAAAVTNLSTDTFRAATTGDSKIEPTVTLPHLCFAPIVLVTSPTDSWFAVTGAYAGLGGTSITIGRPCAGSQSRRVSANFTTRAAPPASSSARRSGYRLSTGTRNKRGAPTIAAPARTRRNRRPAGESRKASTS